MAQKWIFWGLAKNGYFEKCQKTKFPRLARKVDFNKIGSKRGYFQKWFESVSKSVWSSLYLFCKILSGSLLLVLFVLELGLRMTWVSVVSSIFDLQVVNLSLSSDSRTILGGFSEDSWRILEEIFSSWSLVVNLSCWFLYFFYSSQVYLSSMKINLSQTPHEFLRFWKVDEDEGASETKTQLHGSERIMKITWGEHLRCTLMYILWYHRKYKLLQISDNC